MQQPINRFILRLLVFFPLCIGVWWLLWGIQVDTFHAVSRGVLAAIAPGNGWVSRVQHLEIEFRGIDRVSAASVLMDPLALTRGMPIYLALMLAAPKFKAHSRLTLGGLLLLFVAGLFGFTAEAALRLSESTQTQLSGFPLSAAFVQILSKALVTRILPIGLWLWQQWDFVLLCAGCVRR